MALIIFAPSFGQSEAELECELSHCPSPAMSFPHLFSLSHELLIEISSNLSPFDIYAFRRTCRQLNQLIVNSQLLQYISRTALSGVFDPLEPGLSLPGRLDALDRWETAWMEMDLREPDAVIDVPIFPESELRPNSGLLSGQYFIVYHKYDISRGYAFLDMHARSSHTNAAHWTTIKIHTPNYIVALAFASELNLAVAISCVNLPVSAHSFSSGGTPIYSCHIGHLPL
jgi:F-box domain